MVLRDDRGRRRSATQSVEEHVASKLQQEALKALNTKPTRRNRAGSEALRAGTCVRCGFVAKHATPQDCIDFLRDRIADLSGSAEGSVRELD